MMLLGCVRVTVVLSVRLTRLVWTILRVEFRVLSVRVTCLFVLLKYMVMCVEVVMLDVTLVSLAFPLRLLSRTRMSLGVNVASVPEMVLAPAVPELPMKWTFSVCLYGLT